MSHRNSANVTHLLARLAPVAARVNARRIAIIALVLVLLITNGGAG